MDAESVPLRGVPARYGYRVVKRVFDLVLGSIAFIVALPIGILAGLLIKLTSRGPVFFLQPRVGRGGREFTLVKFRTMEADNDDSIHRQYTKDLIAGSAPARRNEQGEEVYLLDDPRVTRVGKVLRRLSFDELPNLLNVLKGDMSLVGPRPPIPYEVESYDARSRQRFVVKPGMTGLAQVNGRGRLTFPEIIEYDLEYVENASLWLDLKIIARTIPAVLGRRGV